MLALSLLSISALYRFANAQEAEPFDGCTATALWGFGLGTNFIDASSQVTAIAVQIEGEGRLDVEFIDTAVSTDGACPSSAPNCVYVLYTIEEGDGSVFVARLNTDTFLLEDPVQVQSTRPATSITFDCDGNLLVTDDFAVISEVNVNTGALTRYSLTSEDQTCSNTGSCNELLFWDDDEQALFRISSSFTSSTAVLCLIEGPDDQECQTITDLSGTCIRTGARIISVYSTNDGSAVVQCQVNGGSSSLTTMDIDNAQISGDVASVEQPSSIEFFNANSGGFCACDFDGENVIDNGEDIGNGNGNGNGDDDDDDSDDDSDDDDSDDDDDDDSSDGSSDDARSFMAEVDQELGFGNDETESDGSVQYTTMQLQLSDNALQMAWIMFALCLVCNLTIVFYLWIKNRAKVQVQV